MKTFRDKIRLVSLLFTTKSSYASNLETLVSLIEEVQENSLIVAPEVCLTGFDYDNFEKAATFSSLALKKIKKISQEKIIILTMIEKKSDGFFNVAKVIYNEEVVYERAKSRLFTFGGEDKYFESGKDEDFKIIEIDGIKIAVLICFELRFKEMWQKSAGADIIAIPSWWGVLRMEHLKALSKTLAIMNQCYVVASDSMNEECSKMSAIITPQGKALYNGNNPCLELEYNQKEIALVRRYMDVGIG
ncbi:MAG: nitrilase [Sulfurimonas sp.]|nr:MAG: nitrilase [Sulfurimonas sp.]